MDYLLIIMFLILLCQFCLYYYKHKMVFIKIIKMTEKYNTDFTVIFDNVGWYDQV